jgi:HTH-type transcriptional regulator/antitoxin HigA
LEGKVRTTTIFDENLASLIPAWNGLKKSAPYFGPIRNERDFVRMKRLMETLLDKVGNDEGHSLADLLDVVSTLVAQYEDQTLGERFDASPNEVLRVLMEEHGLKQSDLRQEIGTQGVVSEILGGERTINIRQAKALANRFGVSPLVFL